MACILNSDSKMININYNLYSPFCRRDSEGRRELEREENKKVLGKRTLGLEFKVA